MEYQETSARAKFSQYAYYFIIGLISLLTLTFVPLLGTKLGLAWELPDTPIGWLVFIVTKLIVAVVNILLFVCFTNQAKINIHNDKRYIEACEILEVEQRKHEMKPRSPRKFMASQYASKGTTIFLSSILSAVGLTNAILSFDLVSFFTYLFTIICGIIFGYMQMRKVEEYWTTEFYEYALKVKREGEKTNGVGIQ